MSTRGARVIRWLLLAMAVALAPDCASRVDAQRMDSNGGAPAVYSDQVIQELLNRWNETADLLADILSFHWSPYAEFPHPTYKGGTPEAYQSFARVLLSFLQHGDNFDFLVTNGLLDLPLYSARLTCGGYSENGSDHAEGYDCGHTSFRQLVPDFATGSNWANISCYICNGLQVYANRIAGTDGSTNVCTGQSSNPGTGGTTGTGGAGTTIDPGGAGGTSSAPRSYCVQVCEHAYLCGDCAAWSTVPPD